MDNLFAESDRAHDLIQTMREEAYRFFEARFELQRFNIAGAEEQGFTMVIKATGNKTSTQYGGNPYNAKLRRLYRMAEKIEQANGSWKTPNVFFFEEWASVKMYGSA